jgi:hypothetical protein
MTSSLVLSELEKYKIILDISLSKSKCSIICLVHFGVYADDDQYVSDWSIKREHKIMIEEFFFLLK